MEEDRDVIKLNNVSKEYTVGDIKTFALKNISLEIKRGETVCILGQSGAGKTTLLNILGGMEKATQGEISFFGENISQYTEIELMKYRRNKVGFIFQFYNLMQNLTAIENIELATEICKDALDPKEILESVGLKDKLNNFPAQLSGGEQQRVSIARAIAKNPDIILCDEPTGALDFDTAKLVIKLLIDFGKKFNKTLIIVTHNQLISLVCEKVIHIKNGTIDKLVYNSKIEDVDNLIW
ncbi:MAG: ABC transporter ATP-binding protein [Acholeplasmatales bacterium]|jgi:putative ABC transport system ATP-binding protein|nr:ABC transporter ATP-binding protein [Acholeplasmatales bacterium]